MKKQSLIKQRLTGWSMALAAATTLGMFSGGAQAIPAGWTCAGTCGTLGPNGVVTAPPGGGSYDYISTAGAVGGNGASLGLGSETNGSSLASSVFHAKVGDKLEFAFNYVTSDGSQFADYAWARLQDVTTSTLVGYLVTARTKPSGSIIPGQGMPAIIAGLTPTSVPIIGGGPAWSPLGGSSGTCFSGPANGCGYTGWVLSDYTIAAEDDYKLEFGVINSIDTLFQSGLAISGATIGGQVIGVPEPGTVALLGLALAGLGFIGRRRKQ